MATYDIEAEIYDLLYHDLNYEESAKELHALLRDELNVADGANLLEAACGTARFLNPLAAWYDVAGFDISQGQIDVAKRNFGHLDLWVADMADFKVDLPYDALCCLFSSIGYLVPQQKLAEGLNCFKNSLKPGGALVIQPWFKPSAFMEGWPGLTSYEDEDIKVSRQTVSKIEDGQCVFDWHFLVSKKGGKTQHFTNRHTLALTEPKTMLRLLDEAGFDMNYTEEGPLASRGLFYGKRR